jgi:WD repeat-containing protein 26
VWQGHNKKEVTRILIQSLTDLGFTGAAKQLCRESGLELERPTVASFRQAVLDGEWDRAEMLLFGSDRHTDGGAVDVGGPFANGNKTVSLSKSPAMGSLPLAEGAVASEMLFWIRQQKFLELVEMRDTGAALTVLRQELRPLNQDSGRLHALSRLVMQLAPEVQ